MWLYEREESNKMGGQLRRDDEGLEKCTIMATKGQTGHLVAATSALESMFAVHALKEGIIPGAHTFTSTLIHVQCTEYTNVRIQDKECQK